MLLEAVIQRGTRASQPGAATVPKGTLYAVTDEGVVERSSGAAWESFSGFSGATSSTVISASLEITGGTIYEIGGGARVEITGDAAADVGFIDLSPEGNPAGAINLSTLGTLDWFAVNGTTTNPPRGATTFHSKVSGGFIFQGFDYMITGGPTFFAANSGAGWNFNHTLTTNVADDIASSALAAVAPSGSGMFTSTGAKYGFKIRVPAGKNKKVLRVSYGSFQDTILITASLTGSAVAAKTYTQNGGNQNIEQVAKIVFAANSGDLVVTFVAQTTGLAPATNPNIDFFWAYLADS